MRIVPRLMGKAEVEALHPLVGGIEDVVLLLLLGHCVPAGVAELVAPYVKGLDRVEEDNIEATDGEKNLVAPAVEGLVVVTVDVDADNVARLHCHVVQGRADSPGAHRVAVLGIPSSDNGVAVRVTENARHEAVSKPMAWLRDGDQCDEKRQHPEVRNGRDDASLLELLRYPRDYDEVDGKHKVGRHHQQVGMECREAQLAQNVRDVRLRRGGGNVGRESDEVERPLLPVLEGSPKSGPIDTLTVVSISIRSF